MNWRELRIIHCFFPGHQGQFRQCLQSISGATRSVECDILNANSGFQSLGNITQAKRKRALAPFELKAYTNHRHHHHHQSTPFENTWALVLCTSQELRFFISISISIARRAFRRGASAAPLHQSLKKKKKEHFPVR